MFLLSSPSAGTRMVLVFRPMDSVLRTACRCCLNFHSQRFSSRGRDDASLFRDRQAQRLSGANHGSIRGSWPMAFSGCPRGPRVVCETGCPRHAAPNFTVETHSRTRASQEPDRPPPGKIPGNGADSRNTQAVCGIRCWASNETPFFQTINAIAAILRASVRRAISGLIPLATRAL
jgi:hypothetical protein